MIKTKGEKPKEILLKAKFEALHNKLSLKPVKSWTEQEKDEALEYLFEEVKNLKKD